MKSISTILFGIALSVSAWASDFEATGTWHDPDHGGHGIVITADSGFGHGVFWFLHRDDRSSAFLIGDANCTEFPCIVALLEPSSGFLGGKYGGGSLSVGDPVGTLEITPTESGFSAKYSLVGPFSDHCNITNPGGIIFRGCIGTIEFERLAF